MKQPEKPFKVAYLVRQKHGDIYAAMRKRGWTNKQTAEFLGISGTAFHRILNFKGRPPHYKDKQKQQEFRSKLIGLTGKVFEDLFPDEVYNDEVLENSRSFDFFVDKDVSQLKIEAGSDTSLVVQRPYDDGPTQEEIMEAAQQVLSEGELNFVNLRIFQGKSLDQMAKIFDVSRESVRQSEAMVFRKLRAIHSVLSGNEDDDTNETLSLETRSALRKVDAKIWGESKRKCFAMRSEVVEI